MTQRFSLSAALTLGIDTFKANLWPLSFAAFLTITASFASLLMCVFPFFVAAPLMLWGFYHLAHLSLSGTPDQDALFEGFRETGRVFGPSLGILLMSLLSWAVYSGIGSWIETGSPVPTALRVGLTTSGAIGIVLLRPFLMAMWFVVVRDELPLSQALGRAIQVVGPRYFPLLLLSLLQQLLMTIGLLLLVIGVFPAWALGTTIQFAALQLIHEDLRL